MGVVRNLFDGLTNALTGAGTATDPRSYNSYRFRKLTDPEIEAAYRGGWIMRKIIDKPASEMVREWRDWQADKADVEAIEAQEKRLQLRQHVRRAEVLRGLGGAGMVLRVKAGDETQPLDPSKIKQGDLLSVLVWHRSRFNLGPMILDPNSPWYGQPSYYELNTAGTVRPRLHPSRVIAFRGDQVPDLTSVSWQDAWWGDSKVQTVLDAVQNSDTAQNGFAALIKDARNRRLAVPGLTERIATGPGEANFTKRVQALAMGESMFGVTFLDAGGVDGKGGETLTDRQMVWQGIPDIGAMYLAAAAGAADMPATVLLGKSPDGMNATGDGDRLIWENTIKARQDLDLRPCLDQLDPILIPSATGRSDPAIWYKFAPLSTLNEKDEATAFWNTMQAMEIAQGTGSIPPTAYDKGMQNLLVERGWIPGLDAALAEVPEGERFPSEAAGNDNEDPSALTQPKGGDPASGDPAGDGSAGRRRAANDAAAILRAAGLNDAADALIAEVGEPADAPFGDGNPDQPRDEHGRWTAGAAHSFIRHAVAIGQPGRGHVLGEVSAGAAAKARAAGHDLAGKTITLDHSQTRHILATHGDERELLRGQHPITHGDLAAAHDIFNAAHSIKPGHPATGRFGHARIEAESQFASRTYTTIGEVRKRTVQIVSMWKR